MLAPRHLLFSALEGALVDPRTDSFSGAEDALAEINRRQIPLVLLTSRTRAEVEPLRRKLGHADPFVTENGSGIFVPDGYFNLRISDGVRLGRYFCIPLGRPYKEVCDALDELAKQCGIGVTGFHNLSTREIAENTGLRPRNAELARAREFEELFYFTTANDQQIARFVAVARERGLAAIPGLVFWRFSGGGDTARAVRTLTRLFAEATRLKLKTIGIGAGSEDLLWLRAVDSPVLLPSANEARRINSHAQDALGGEGRTWRLATGESPGPVGWSASILKIIS